MALLLIRLTAVRWILYA